MALPAGSRLGPYEILSTLGVGGMGEVYRARDPRLGRDVALKLVTLGSANDTDRLIRFEQEARATAALNHPNILAVHDVGRSEFGPYIVSELLDGQSLRQMMALGPLPVAKALRYAQQIARGLAAAHRRGIVHRDLKPENVFITADSVVKILDFGLAKLTERHSSLAVGHQTTALGLVVGTTGYMSPEQARGEAIDERSDIFSFGSVVYEMLAGQRAFQGNSAIETLSAILRENPPELGQITNGVHPGIERIVERCLEKNRDDRFQSAADLGFALESLSGMSTPKPLPARPRRMRLAIPALLLVVAAAALVIGASSRLFDREPPKFQQLTFRRGMLQGARFAADGDTIVYAGAWEGNPAELFSTRPSAPEARSLQLTSTGLYSLSSKGEMAVILDPHGFGRVDGTLARVSLAGGVPRQLSHDVLAADWSPDGSNLAVVQSTGGRTVIEYPIGQTLYDPSPGNVTHLRFSPSGDALAFIVHPVSGDTAGSVMLIDLKGQAKTLSAGWNTVLGLAWSPDGREVWFTGAKSGAAQALHAVTRSGAERLLFRAPATLTLHDVARDGRVLLTRDAWGAGVMARTNGSSAEREFSWLDGTMAWDLSTDGTTAVLEESWEGGGAARSVYLRTLDGQPAVRLGEGVPLALSPDKQWVVTTPVAADHLTLLPTGVGQPKVLPRGGVSRYGPTACWLPDGRRILFSASEANKKSRIYLQSIDGGEPRPITDEGVFGRLTMLPGGDAFVTRGLDRKLVTVPVTGGAPRPIAGAEASDMPIVASDDGTWLYVQAETQVPAPIARINLRTGQRDVVRTLRPIDPSGVTSVLRIVMTPDAETYAYTYIRAISELYLVTGIR